MSVMIEGLVVTGVFAVIMFALVFSLGSKDKVGCGRDNCECVNDKLNI